MRGPCLRAGPRVTGASSSAGQSHTAPLPCASPSQLCSHEVTRPGGETRGPDRTVRMQPREQSARSGSACQSHLGRVHGREAAGPEVSVLAPTARGPSGRQEAWPHCHPPLTQVEATAQFKPHSPAQPLPDGDGVRGPSARADPPPGPGHLPVEEVEQPGEGQATRVGGSGFRLHDVTHITGTMSLYVRGAPGTPKAVPALRPHLCRERDAGPQHGVVPSEVT